MGDITVRALEVLQQVELILAEDTRTTSILLKKYKVETPLKSYHSFNEHKIVDRLVDRIEKGMDMALVTDAGTPGVSDPGFLLVRDCLRRGLPVECLPGATALIPALVVSGLPSDRFCFEGFLPAKKGRTTRLQGLTNEERTLVIYESPHRLLKTLADLSKHLGGERQASVSKELTKIHEETIRGTLDDVLKQLEERVIKGEYVIIVQGNQ